jgi:protein associated with RNAse G/E
MWKPGDIAVWRGIFRNRVWHAVPSFVVKDTLQELVLAVIPGTNCMVEENYAKSHKNGKRRWDFKEKDWLLEEFTWHTNRLLFLLEPEKYYSTIFFWNGNSNEFLGYYVNFQLPFQRSHCGIDTLDLDLDIVIEPDLSFRWKDEDDYQKAIENEIIFPEWIKGIEADKPEILHKLEKHQYPFDSSWLNWKPDPTWSPPTLPENWNEI